MFAEPQRVSISKRLAKKLFSISQFQMRQVVSVQVKNVEEVVHDRNRLLLALLQERKSRDTALERHNLAIHNEARCGLFKERCD